MQLTSVPCRQIQIGTTFMVTLMRLASTPGQKMEVGLDFTQVVVTAIPDSIMGPRQMELSCMRTVCRL